MPQGVGNELHLAAERGDVTAVRTLLGSGTCHLGQRDEHGRTTLQLAVSGGTESHVEIVYLLLCNGTKVTRADAHGISALDLAVLEQQWDVVRLMAVHDHSLLLQQLDAPALRGYTLLECAYVVQEDPSQLPWLLELGAAPTHRALQAAVERGDHASLQAMLRSPAAALDSCLHMDGWRGKPGRTSAAYMPEQLRRHVRDELACAQKAVKKILRREGQQQPQPPQQQPQPPPQQPLPQPQQQQQQQQEEEALLQAAVAFLQVALPAGAQQGLPQWQGLVQAFPHAGIPHAQLNPDQGEALEAVFAAALGNGWGGAGVEGIDDELDEEPGIPELAWPLQQAGQGLLGPAAGAAGEDNALPGPVNLALLAAGEGVAAGEDGQEGPAARLDRRQRRAGRWHTRLLGLLGHAAAQARLDEWMEGRWRTLKALRAAWRRELEEVQQRLKDCWGWGWGSGQQCDSCALLEGRASQLSTQLERATGQLLQWPGRNATLTAQTVRQLIAQLTEVLDGWGLPMRPPVIEEPPFWAGSLLHRAIQRQDARAVALLLSAGKRAGSGSTSRPAAAAPAAQLQHPAMGSVSPWHCGVEFIDEAVIASPAWDGLLAVGLLPCYPWDCPFYQAVLQFHQAAEQAPNPVVVAAADQACARVVTALLEGGAEPLLGRESLLDTELLRSHRASATVGSVADWSRLTHRFFHPNFKALVWQVLLSANADPRGLGKLPSTVLDKVLRQLSCETEVVGGTGAELAE